LWFLGLNLMVAAGPGPGVPVASAAEDAPPASPIYGKPFLQRGTAAVGGYMDIEFLAGEDGSTFDQHRFVPFLYAEVSDRVHVASEIEFEHGGLVSGGGGTDGEIKVEFATIDIAVGEPLNVRGGVLLSPLGRTNIYHDAPMLDLTERPLVDRSIIPTTLSESGLGVYGTVYPSDLVVVQYEAYLVNGFDDGTVNGDGVLSIRSGRGSQRNDNNNSRAFTGRVNVSPRLGTDIGVSVHTGDYDSEGRRNLTIAALDFMFARGPVEVLGTGATARADLSAGDVQAVAGAAPEDPAKAAGFFLEGRVHFLAGAVAGLPQGVFTGTVRADYVDRDTNVDGHDQERLTLGVNLRITEETVVKNDVLFDRERASGSTSWGDTGTAYRFSLATYF
jgi:hypothetical protein